MPAAGPASSIGPINARSAGRLIGGGHDERASGAAGARTGRPARGITRCGGSFCGPDAGCSWFGESEKPPLPGERVSALQLNRQLNVDPELAGTDVILPAPYVNDGWAQPGGNQTHAMYHLKASAAALQQIWSVDIGASADSDDNRLLAEPVVADNAVFAMDADSVVSAYDAANGSWLWRDDLTPDDEDDNLFGGGIAWSRQAGRLHSVRQGVRARRQERRSDMGSGGARRRCAPRLRSATAASSSSPSTTSWSSTRSMTGASCGPTPASKRRPACSAAPRPRSTAIIVVAAYTSGELLAFDVTDGRSLWTDSLAGGARGNAIATLTDIRGRPVIDRDYVIAIGNGGVMAAIDSHARRPRLGQRPRRHADALGRRRFHLRHDQRQRSDLPVPHGRAHQMDHRRCRSSRMRWRRRTGSIGPARCWPATACWSPDPAALRSRSRLMTAASSASRICRIPRICRRLSPTRRVYILSDDARLIALK